MKTLNRHMIALALGVSTLISMDAYASNTSVQVGLEGDLAPIDRRPRLWMYKQDPSVLGFSKPEQVISLTTVENGPRNRFMSVQQSRAAKSASGDFNALTYNQDQVDSISTFAGVNQVYTMYRMDLERMRAREPQNIIIDATIKMWDSGVTKPLMIYPHAGTDKNAFYSRDQNGNRVLKFFSFPETGTNNVVHTCQSLDIVAHETGHALLDLLKPVYFSTDNPQTGALHEAFGDVTAIFVNLEQPDLAEKVFVESRGNLHTSTFLNKVAEEFGTALGNNDGLRNADKDFKLSHVGDEVHDLSQVFTGAVYDVLAEGALNHQMANGMKTPGSILLYEAGRHVREVLLQSIVESTLPSPYFSDIGHAMYTTFKKREQEKRDPIATLNWSSYLVKQFQMHEIDVMLASSSVTDAKKPLKLERHRICGTLMKQAATKSGEAFEDALTSSEGSDQDA